MVQSMTGFATKQLTLALDAQSQVNVTLNIKSLNSRFFETTCKFPAALSTMETDLINVCKAQLRRGHIFFTISVSPSNLFKTEVEPALPVVNSYLKAIEKIKTTYKLEGSLTITDLIQLPNIFSVEEKSLDQQARTAILNATQELVAILIEARKKEGLSIIKDIEQRWSELTQHIQTIEQRAAILMQERKADISNKIHLLGTAPDQIIEAQRSALYNELLKIDINEEIVRFKSHLQNLQAILNSSDVEKGKRLDFTLQELVREVNTVASKSADATIGSLVINSKVELEKIREQVQNVV
jgi:uncharacterized protein (TIGR00255 family)